MIFSNGMYEYQENPGPFEKVLKKHGIKFDYEVRPDLNGAYDGDQLNLDTMAWDLWHYGAEGEQMARHIEDLDLLGSMERLHLEATEEDIEE